MSYRFANVTELAAWSVPATEPTTLRLLHADRTHDGASVLLLRRSVDNNPHNGRNPHNASIVLGEPDVEQLLRVLPTVLEAWKQNREHR